MRYRKERLGDGAILFKNASFSTLVWRFFENPEDADAQRQPQAWMHKYRTEVDPIVQGGYPSDGP